MNDSVTDLASDLLVSKVESGALIWKIGGLCDRKTRTASIFSCAVVIFTQNYWKPEQANICMCVKTAWEKVQYQLHHEIHSG